MSRVDKQLNGKVAVVTGASSGVGKAIAIALADEGASVALVARRLERLKELQTEIKQRGGVACPIQTDVTIREQVKSMVREVEATLGYVDILINSAGIGYGTLMKNAYEDQWDTMLEVNCKGLNNCIAAVLNRMIERKNGHIVNMSSIAGRKGIAGAAVYCGTKFYIEGLSKSLREELIGKKVKVTCLQFAMTDGTEIYSFSTDQEALRLLSEREKFQFLNPEDIAKAVVYITTQPSYSTVNQLLIQPRDDIWVA